VSRAAWSGADFGKSADGDKSQVHLVAPRGPRSLSRVLAMATLAALLLTFWSNRRDLITGIEDAWGELLFWTIVILLVNFLYVDLEPVQFTLDLPLLVAVSLLYAPPVAGLVAFLGSADVREFRRRIGVFRAVYNRSQIGLSVFVASAAYHAVSSSLEEWPNAILGTALATAVFTSLNGILVSAYVASHSEASFHRVMLRLHVGRPFEFLLTYFAYGILAYAVSRLFLDAGAWSVPLFMVPIVIAHVAFVRAERLAALASNLKVRERLLELAMDRIVDERKDERLRIASGLHDDVLQSLIRISQLGFFLGREVEAGSQAASDAAELQRLTTDTMSTLREVVGDLRHSPVGRDGLVRTLTGLAKDIQLESRIRIDFDAESIGNISGDRQLLLYQVGKEAVMNAVKHADPGRIQIDLRVAGKGLVLAVEDDGKGFDPLKVDESRHFGLGLIRERLRMGGGGLHVQSCPGRTRIEAWLPIEREASAEESPSVRMT
jgi:signal transduction histidine kinase